jgi:hypothetical protein
MLEKLPKLLAAWRRKLSRHSTERDPGELTMDEVEDEAWTKHDPTPPTSNWTGGG